jgi:hypothetical protein
MLIPMMVNPLYLLISFVLIFAVYEITKRLCGRKLAKISIIVALPFLATLQQACFQRYFRIPR